MAFANIMNFLISYKENPKTVYLSFAPLQYYCTCICSIASNAEHMHACKTLRNIQQEFAQKTE